MGLWQLGKVKLVWREPGPTQGLEITMRRRPLGEVVQRWLTAGEELEDRRPWGDLSWTEKAESAQRSAADIAELVIDWNIAGDDGAVATITAESLLAYCDFDTINDIWERYAESTTRVAPPLPSSSDGGRPLEETALQLPMEPLSDSPA